MEYNTGKNKQNKAIYQNKINKRGYVAGYTKLKLFHIKRLTGT